MLTVKAIKTLKIYKMRSYKKELEAILAANKYNI